MANAEPLAQSPRSCLCDVATQGWSHVQKRPSNFCTLLGRDGHTVLRPLFLKTMHLLGLPHPRVCEVLQTEPTPHTPLPIKPAPLPPTPLPEAWEPVGGKE